MNQIQKTTIAGAVALVAAAAGSADAAMITFIYTGVGSGTIGGVAFGPSAFTFTGVADNTNRVSFSDGFIIAHDSATLDIAGVGVLDVSTSTSSAVNWTSDSAIFGNSATDAALYIVGSDASLDGYDMTTSIGPISALGSLLQWAINPLATTGGTVEFFSGSTDGSFQAIVVPAPATAGVVAISGLGVFRRRR